MFSRGHDPAAMTLSDLIDLEAQLARDLPPDIARALVAGLARDGTWAAPPRSGRRGRAARDPRRAGGRRPGPGVDHGGRPLALHRGQAGERLGLPPRLRRPPVAAPCALADVVLPPGSRAGDAAAGPLSWSGRGGLSVARGARLGIDRRPAGDVARSVASPPQPPVALSSRRALDAARPHAGFRRRLQRGRNPRVPAADRLLGHRLLLEHDARPARSGPLPRARARAGGPVRLAVARCGSFPRPGGSDALLPPGRRLCALRGGPLRPAGDRRGLVALPARGSRVLRPAPALSHARRFADARGAIAVAAAAGRRGGRARAAQAFGAARGDAQRGS